MKKSFLFMLIILGFSFNLVFGASDLLSCEFKSINSCESNEVLILAANENFEDGLNRTLSSNIAFDTSFLGYKTPLCCKINPTNSGQSLGNLEINYIQSTLNCPLGSEDLLYFTSNTNARVALKQNITDFTDYSYKMCVKIPTDFSKLNIFVSTTDYSFAGYKCLFRISSEINGLVSDCDAKFNGPNKYNQIVWAKLIENIDSLKCNLDCTSKLDGRVYSACGAKIPECKFVSSACDGSVYGAFVKSGDYEVQCSASWNNTRNLAFTTENVVVSSVNNKCSNLIQRKYSVLLNNELVTMSVYICGEN